MPPVSTRNVLSYVRDHLGDVSDATIASVAGKTSVVSGLTAGVGGLTSTDIAAFGGLAVAVVTGIVGLIYKHRDSARQAVEHARRARLDEIDLEIKTLTRDQLRDSRRHPVVCD